MIPMQRLCTSRLRMSLIVTPVAQCTEVTQPQQLCYREAVGWALLHQPGSLASASGRALAGGTGSTSPCPSAPPCATAALAAPAGLRGVTSTSGHPHISHPQLPALLKAMAELAIRSRGRVPPHAAETEILLVSEAPLFISPEERDEKIKERLLTAALLSQQRGWRPSAVFSNQNQPQFGIGLT